MNKGLKGLCLGLSLAASLIGHTALSKPATPEVKAVGTLNAEASQGTISRYVYGQFSEHLGGGIYDGTWVGEDSKIPNVRGVRTDIVTALKDIHVPVIRWPGGCFADEYFWRDGIGPRADRPVRKNNWWGNAPETNQFGTHEFMDFIDQVGSEAYFSVNVGSSTPKDMREWVEYMTSDGQDTLANERRKNGRDAPYKVAFWGIGNESWGCGGNMRPEYYADEYRRFTESFHKSETNQGWRVASGSNAGDYNWTEVLMKNAGRKMEAISLHYYTLPTGKWDKKGAALGFTQQEWVDTMANTLKMEEYIKGHSAVMDKYDPEKKVALFVDEWGTWYDVEAGTNPGFLYQQNSLRDGVVAAANLNIFHHYTDRVKMTNIAQTINVLQAMILTQGDKIALTPTYYVYKMYVPFQDAQALDLNVQSPSFTLGGKTLPYVSSSAARAKDGHVYIALANLNPTEGITLTIDLKGLKAKGVSGQVLTSKAMDAHNVPGQAEMIKPEAFKGAKLSGTSLNVALPSKSVVVVRLD